MERSILDYQTHLNKLGPLLAFNFAMAIANTEIKNQYGEMMNKIQKD